MTQVVASDWTASMFSQPQAQSLGSSQTPAASMASSMHFWALPSQAPIDCAEAAAARVRMATEYFILAVLVGSCKNNE